MRRKGFQSEKLDQYVLRLPNGMRDSIKEVAAENMRSMNAEIVMAIKERIDSHKKEKADATAS